MHSDEERDEYENVRTKLLSENPTEPSRRLHVRSQILDVNSMANTSSLGKNSLLNPSSEESKPSFFPAIPKRFIMLILLALATFNMYCTRMCLNVTIVAMTHSEVKIYNSSGPYLSKDMEPEFHWDKQFQGTILASLYWSYTAMQIPAGPICVKFGGAFLLGIAIFGSSVLTLITPFIVRLNVYAFIIVRILEGGFLGLVAVSAVSLVSKWAPIYERSIFLMVARSGSLWGTVFANVLSGFLADSFWGWPSVFYFFGVQGILWFLCWLYFGCEEPSDHPNITKAELEHIGQHWKTKLSLRDIPWRYMLTSIRVWAIIIPNFTDCWCFYTFMILFPSYLKDAQNLDITTIGLASSLPYVCSAVVSPTWGYFIDVLRSKEYISTITGRKFSNFIGAGISGIFVVGMVYASTVTSAIVIFTIATMLANINAVGPSASIIELAPKYSGILMGIINFICGIAGFISPQVVGTLTVHGNIRHQWEIVFYMTAGINVFGMIFYLCFGSSEKQTWADY